MQPSLIAVLISFLSLPVSLLKTISKFGTWKLLLLFNIQFWLWHFVVIAFPFLLITVNKYFPSSIKILLPFFNFLIILGWGKFTLFESPGIFLPSNINRWLYLICWFSFLTLPILSFIPWRSAIRDNFFLFFFSTFRIFETTLLIPLVLWLKLILNASTPRSTSFFNLFSLYIAGPVSYTHLRAHETR